MKLTGKFLLMLIGIPLVILLITSTITYTIQKNTIEKEIVLQQHYLVNEVANGVYAEIQQLGQKAADISSLPIVKSILKNSPTIDYIQDEFLQNPDYAEYLETINGFVDENVVLAYIVSEQTGALIINQWIDLPDQYDGRVKNYYQEPVSLNGLFVSEPYMNAEGTDDPTAITVSYPIRENGNLLGVSAIDIGLAGITNYAAEIGEKYNAVIGLFTLNGTVIYHPKATDKSIIYNFSDFLKVIGVANQKEVEDVLYSGVEGQVIVDAEEDSFAIATPVPGTSWMVSVSFPVKIITAKIIRSVLPVTIISSLIILLSLGIIAYVLNISVIKNILLTSDYLKTIASGDLLIKINPKLISRNDEIGTLAQSLSNMTENLQDIVGKVTAAANYIASGSLQVSDSSQMLSSGATEQAASAEEVSSSMEEMSSNISQNADNSSQTEKIAIKAARDAKESGKTVKEALDAMSLIASKITIIEEISRSTNLLALNAAIEAARAGEHGRGFAVVATEVRKLAEQSQRAAGEITELASNTVTLSKGSGEKLSKLVPDIERTAELVEEISAASNEQQAGVDQITTAIHQLDKIIQSNASSSEELASTSEQLAAQAEQLKETIQYFKISDKVSARAPKKVVETAEKREKIQPKPNTVKSETGITLSPDQKMGEQLSEDFTNKIFDDDFESF